ncbi:MAG: PilZ domain-containing protein [Sulfurimicrobium sp.]
MPFAKANQQQNRAEPDRARPAPLRLIHGGPHSNEPRGEMRCSRRIPLECYVKARVVDSGEIFYAMSKDLSVDGLAFTAHYVPRFGEMMEIQLQSPRGSTLKPFKALVQVRRCVCLDGNKGYEIGTAIMKVRQ